MEDLNQIDRVTVQPGDRFVVRTPSRVPDVIMARIGEYVAKSLGVPVDRVLVLDDGMTLAAVTGLDERRVPDLLAANNRYHERNVRLSSALLAAVQQFRFYERQHRAKDTPEATVKADVNERMAMMLESTVLARGTVPSAWFAFANAHQIALNFMGVLDTVLALHDVKTSEAHADLRASWAQQLDALGAMALEEAPEGALTIALSPDAELPQDVVRLVIAARAAAYQENGEALKALDAAVEAFADRVAWDDAPELEEGQTARKPTAMTEAGAIAAGGSALVRAFLHQERLTGGADDHVDAAALNAFVAYAVEQLKGRAQALAQGVITPEQARVVHVDFDRAGSVESVVTLDLSGANLTPLGVGEVYSMRGAKLVPAKPTLAPVSCPSCGRNLYTDAPCCEKCPDGGVL